jgi:hypothetical protein
MDHQHDDECIPSIRDIRIGHLLHLMSQLKFYKAKTLLEDWYW